MFLVARPLKGKGFLYATPTPGLFPRVGFTDFEDFSVAAKTPSEFPRATHIILLRHSQGNLRRGPGVCHMGELLAERSD